MPDPPAPWPPTPRARLVAAAVCGALAALFVALTVLNHGAHLFSGHYDDSYITYRYARNLATGVGPYFNEGEAVNAASSLLYMLVLALAYLVGLHDLPAVSGALGLAAGASLPAAAFLLLWRATGRMALASGAGLVVATTGLLHAWGSSGMETTVFVAACLWALVAHAFRSLPWTLVAIVAAILLRPEGAAIAAAIGLGELARRDLRRFAFVALAGIVGVLVIVLTNLAFYGELLPHPLRFKEAARYYHQEPGVAFDRLQQYLADRWRVLAMAAAFGATVAALRWRSRPELVTPGLAALVYVPLVVMAPFADLYRYVTPILPLVAVGAFALLAHVTVGRRTAVLAVVLALAGLGAWAPSALAEQEEARTFFAPIPEHAAVREAAGTWVAQQGPDVSIASSDVGAIAWFAPQTRVIDVLGLTSDVFIDNLPDSDANIRYLVSQRPTFFLDTRVYENVTAAENILVFPDQTYLDARVPTVYPPGSIYEREFVGETLVVLAKRIYWGADLAPR